MQQELFLTDRKNRLKKVLMVAEELRKIRKAEVRPCKWCGDSTTYPDQLCSGRCREEFYNESSYELETDDLEEYNRNEASDYAEEE